MPYAMSDGVQIHYQVEGSGAPVLLHPGFVSSLLDWYQYGYVDALKGDYQLILLDPRGQGQSEKPHDSEAYSQEQRVTDVVAVLDTLGMNRAHFWGYSMGGGIGFLLAKRAPERLHSLVLGGAAPFGRPPNAAWAELFHRGMEAFITEGVERAMGPLPAETRALWLTNDAEALAAAIVGTPNLEADLSSMNLPALVYCGDQDPPHAGAKRATELMPNATFVSLPGLTHLPAFFGADVVLPHVQAFLQGVTEVPAARA